MDDYEAKLKEQVERLTSWSYRDIEAAVIEKRISWIKEHAMDSTGSDPVTPRQAFERLFFDYMGLSPADLIVVEEDEDRITWLSKNPCPTLDACQKLGLDTRAVCQAISEKPAQAFISRLNPRLRFVRDYQEIRPYADHCLESILNVV